ncbi:MAG: NCS2 family permease, partial [Candidatus Sumerlaeia bacterium]|nr:NCS2 family permease [Candidatus Sumerlaeia bacterium]
MFEKYFRLAEHRTTVRIEALAGLTTFLTMAYIIFVQPAVLSGVMFGFETGMDFNSVLVATCVAAAIGTLLMAFLTNYPIALAPGMGLNFFMVFSAMPAAARAGHDDPWAVALGCVFISGVIFTILSLFRIREMLLNAISLSLKNGIAVGIGLFIAFIGLQNSGFVVGSEGTLVDLTSDIVSPDILVFFFGLIVTAVLVTRGHRWGILAGIISATVLSAILLMVFRGSESETIQNSALLTRFQFDLAVVSLPPSIAPTFLKLDLLAAIAPAMLPVVIVFLFVDMFDTMGTLIGVTQQAGLMENGQLPRANKAFLSDALGSSAGALLGTSTVTSFIESSAGV